jgi:hypothetical protein
MQCHRLGYSNVRISPVDPREHLWSYVSFNHCYESPTHNKGRLPGPTNYKQPRSFIIFHRSPMFGHSLADGVLQRRWLASSISTPPCLHRWLSFLIRKHGSIPSVNTCQKYHRARSDCSFLGMFHLGSNVSKTMLQS